MTSNQPEMFYDPQRSPGSHRSAQRPPQLRPFDAFGSQPVQPWNQPDDHSQSYMAQYSNRMNATLGAGYPSSYDGWGSHANTFAPSSSNPLSATLGGAARRNPVSSRGRPGLPPGWGDMPDTMPSLGNLDVSPVPYGLPSEGQGNDNDDELIPTAIVIKNIPFAVKKEQLVALMTDLGLPLPYAFNYHFDQGVFRGLAFANFTTPQETSLVIQHLNHYDLAGRKLRVEYKKMLPVAERERIEREKRIKRGQLEEQHRPIGPGAQLQNQSSLSSLTSQMPTSSPSPVSSRPRGGFGTSTPAAMEMRTLPPEVDFNDQAVLNIYSQLLLFKNGMEPEMTFPANLSPTQRRMVHTIAHHLGLTHLSKGDGDMRQVHIYRYSEAQRSPSNLTSGHHLDTQRRALNRAATTDFSDVRGDQFYTGPSVARQASTGLFGGFPDSAGLHASHNLRGVKSYADLRSYTPSPVPSTASFPTNNAARFADYVPTSNGAFPTSSAPYTPGSVTSSGSTMTVAATTMGQVENLLVNSLNTMSLGGNAYGAGGSPRSARSMWDQPAPIGSNRAFSSTTQSLDEPTRGGQQQPQRQPRGPTLGQGSGFSRFAEPQQNGHASRSSDELPSQRGSSRHGKDMLSEQ